jgi:hypothetical protein
VSVYHRLPYNDNDHYNSCGGDSMATPRWIPFPTMKRLRCNTCHLILIEQDVSQRKPGEAGFDIEQFVIQEWP